MSAHLQSAATQLSTQWGLSLPNSFTQEQVVAAIAEKIAVMIAEQPEQFIQLLYRLDVSEKKVSRAAHQKDTALQIAQLIYDRQLQKIISRKENRPPVPGDDEEDMRW